MLRPLKRSARVLLEKASAYHPDHRDAALLSKREKASRARCVRPERRHLDDAIAWIERAQQAAGGCGGVSWGYRARVPVRSGQRAGWENPYPETTGYIIPTMLRYASLAAGSGAAEAARRMADWELSIQLPDGGFQGGIFGSLPVSASTFVTGQVLFGLTAACREWGSGLYGSAAARAGDFLLACLDDSGRFVRGYSHFCAAGPKAYEVRTGFALAEAGTLLDIARYRAAAGRMGDYALSCQQPNGWFRENDLDEHDRPLTHTIGYALEGLHGLGVLLNRTDCIDAVRRTLNRIAQLIGPDGFLAGRWHADWTPAATWACLTGSSQIAGVFLRMYCQLGDPLWLESGRRLLGFVCFTQEIAGPSPALTGGIRGSFPFDGDYGKWCVLNWATKFFADSLMDYLEIEPATGA